MINNNIKSQLFQCKCFCKSVKSRFVLRGASPTDLHSKEREERKEMKTCQIMLCTTDNGGGGDRLE